MRRLLLVMLVAACDRGRSEPNDKPTRPPGVTAQGSLVFDEPPGRDVRLMLATEAELLSSEPILRRVRDELRADDLSTNAVSAQRRGETLLLDVSVTHVDSRKAITYCNVLIRAYIEHRMDRSMMAVRLQQEALAREIESAPENATIRKKLEELEIEAMTRKMDVRVVDSCTVKQ